MPSAWEHVAINLGEWTVPDQDCKIKFIMFIDLATRYRVVEPLFKYKHGESRAETADQIISIQLCVAVAHGQATTKAPGG